MNEKSLDLEAINSEILPKEVESECKEDQNSFSTNLSCEQINGLIDQNTKSHKKDVSCNLKSSVKYIEDGEIDICPSSNPIPVTLKNQVKSNGRKTRKNIKPERIAKVSKFPPVWVRSGREFKTKGSATASFNEAKTKDAGNCGNSSSEINESAKDYSNEMGKGKGKVKKQESKQSSIPDFISKDEEEGIFLVKSSLNTINNNSGHFIEFTPSKTESEPSVPSNTDIETFLKSEISPMAKTCSVSLEEIKTPNQGCSDTLNINDGLLEPEANQSYLKKRNKSQKKSHQNNEVGKSCHEKFKVSTNADSALVGSEPNSDTEQPSMHVEEHISSFNEGQSFLKEGVKISPRKRKHSSIDDKNYAEAKQELDSSKVQSIEIEKINKNKRKRTKDLNLETNKTLKLQDCQASLELLNEPSQRSDPEQNNQHNIIPTDNKSSKIVHNRKKNVLKNAECSDTQDHNKMFQTRNKSYILKKGKLSQGSLSIDANDMQSKKIKGNVKISTCNTSTPKIIGKLEKSSNKEIYSMSEVTTIEDFFQFIKMRQPKDRDLETNAHSLKIILSNHENYPDIPSLLFSLIKYLSNSEESPMLSFLECEKVSVLLPPEEDCIITALFLIESEEIPHLKELLKTIVNKIQHLISKKSIHTYGLASLCRAVTEISKRRKDTFAPLVLCSTLLKMKHQFAPYLIASVVGVWRELFQVEDGLSDEEIVFHSAIAYGAKKKTLMADIYWNASNKIISKYFDSRSVIDVQRSIRLLMNIIEINCYDNSWAHIYNLTSALVIFVVYEDWKWIKEHVLTSYVVPHLNKFGNENINEKAFDVFCNIYVEIFLVNPSKNPQEEVLVQFFKENKVSKVCSPIQESAALALMKLWYLKKIELSKIVTKWFETNHKDPKVLTIKRLFKRV